MFMFYIWLRADGRLMESERVWYSSCVSLACLPVEYNAIDDYLADAADGMEAALMRNVSMADRAGRGVRGLPQRHGCIVPPHFHSPLPHTRLPPVSHPCLRSNRETDIKDGCDELVLALRKLVDVNFDKFEMYALKNVFTIPEDVAGRLHATAAGAPSTAGSTLLSTPVGCSGEEDHAAVSARIEALQTQVIVVRARGKNAHVVAACIDAVVRLTLREPRVYVAACPKASRYSDTAYVDTSSQTVKGYMRPRPLTCCRRVLRCIVLKLELQPDKLLGVLFVCRRRSVVVGGHLKACTAICHPNCRSTKPRSLDCRLSWRRCPPPALTTHNRRWTC